MVAVEWECIPGNENPQKPSAFKQDRRSDRGDTRKSIKCSKAKVKRLMIIPLRSGRAALISLLLKALFLKIIRQESLISNVLKKCDFGVGWCKEVPASGHFS